MQVSPFYITYVVQTPLYHRPRKVCLNLRGEEKFLVLSSLCLHCYSRANMVVEKFNLRLGRHTKKATSIVCSYEWPQPRVKRPVTPGSINVWQCIMRSLQIMKKTDIVWLWHGEYERKRTDIFTEHPYFLEGLTKFRLASSTVCYIMPWRHAHEGNKNKGLTLNQPISHTNRLFFTPFNLIHIPPQKGPNPLHGWRETGN